MSIRDMFGGIVGVMVLASVACMCLIGGVIWLIFESEAQRAEAQERLIRQCVAGDGRVVESITPRGRVVTCIPEGYQGNVDIDMGDETIVMQQPPVVVR